MNAVQAVNRSGDLPGLCIHYVHARATCDVEPVRRGIGGQVVPAPIAAQLPLVDHFVRLLRGDMRGNGGQSADKNACGEGETKQMALEGHFNSRQNPWIRHTGRKWE